MRSFFYVSKRKMRIMIAEADCCQGSGQEISRENRIVHSEVRIMGKIERSQELCGRRASERCRTRTSARAPMCICTACLLPRRCWPGKAREDTRLADIAAMLHDLAAYESGSYDDHAHRGAELAKGFSTSSGLRRRKRQRKSAPRSIITTISW